MAGENISAITEALVIENLKNVAGASAAAQAVIYQDQAASRNRLNILAESLLGKMCHKLQDLDISDAVAQNAVQRGGADAGINSLLAAISSGSLMNKTVSVTPPETGVSRSFADIAALLAIIESAKAKA